MPQPITITNPADAQSLEGLYIIEQTPDAAIAGIPLNATVIVGETIRGPVGRAVLIGSPARFMQVYGGRDQGSGGSYRSPVWTALQNKPFASVYIVRATAAAAAVATHTFSDATPTAIMRVDATGPGVYGNGITVDVLDATDLSSNHFNLRVTYLGVSTLFQNLDMSATNVDNSLATIGDDDGNLVVVTKLANGRPIDVTGVALTGGSDGTIADSDFTATGGPIEIANAIPNVGSRFVAERSSAALKSKILAMAAVAASGEWLVCPDNSTVSPATAITEAATLRGDRVTYCFNNTYTLDGQVGALMLTDPKSWMASIISQTDVDVHVGEQDTKQFTAGIRRLAFPSLTRADYIALKAAGISALEFDTDGFAFVSGVTTSITPGKQEISRRRCADFLEIGISQSLKYDVKKKNVQSRRDTMIGKVDAFLSDLANAERVVDRDPVTKKGLFSVTDPTTTSQRSLGVQRFRIAVKLIGHMLYIILEFSVDEAGLSLVSSTVGTASV